MAFKMAGWSAFTKETNLPEEEQQKITDKKTEEKMEKIGFRGPTKEEWEAMNLKGSKVGKKWDGSQTSEEKLRKKRKLNYNPQSKRGVDRAGDKPPPVEY